MTAADSDLGAADLLARTPPTRLGNPMIIPIVLPLTESDGPVRRIPPCSDIATCTVNALLTRALLALLPTPALRFQTEEITGELPATPRF